jgi:predicted DNA-binding transcriptional regulator AlpA
MTNLASPLVDEKQASEILGLAPGTLSVWRCEKRYPLPYVKVGRSIRYRLADLERFVESRTVGAATTE